jgi:general secretion pathway protein D
MTRSTSLTARIVVALFVAGCATAEVHHREAMRLLAEGKREAAIAELRVATREEPGNSLYRVELLKQQAAYAGELVARGDLARGAGNGEEAAALYREALRVEPGNDAALRGLNGLQLDARHVKLLGEAERALAANRLDAARTSVGIVLNENPGNAAARALLATIQGKQEAQERASAAHAASQSILRRPVTLQFREANLRMVFEALSRVTGLNVILDRDVRADLKTTIFVKDASVEDTVDLILLQNQLEKRTLNSTTLFIYPATQAKQKEYQDLQIHTFRISNADPKYLQSVLRNVLRLGDVVIDERSGTLVVRDTPEAIAVASKVIAAHDVPDAEVMLEVDVLEVSRDRLSNIGIQFPNSVTIATPQSADTIGKLRALKRDDLTVTPLALGINLRLEDTDTNLLASPRIRASNREKARVLIGDRVPTIVNTVTPVATGASVVTGTVQYQDVGLKLEFEPHVYSDFDVGIKLNLEVSNIVKEIPGPQGSLSYQIGTRNAQTTLRLRDGETQVLGGLISDQDRNTAATVPGLGHLPMIGRLFGNNNGTHTKTEVVLSITPHILRGPPISEPEVRDIFSGTETQIRERPLRLDAIGEVRGTFVAPASPSNMPAPAAREPRSTPPAPAPAEPPATAPAVPPAPAQPQNGAVPPAPAASGPRYPQ